MTEATDKEASTLHRLLGLGKLDDEGIYTRHSDYEGAPIDADVIVVDELSMVDMFVMNYLSRNKTNTSRRCRPISISRTRKCIKRFNKF